MRYAPKEKFELLKDQIGTRCTPTHGQPCEELHGIESVLADGSIAIYCHAVDSNSGADLVEKAKLTYPKTLLKQADYLYAKDFFSKEQWLSDYESLINTSKKWVNTGLLKDQKEGKIDDTHEVRLIDDAQYQFELQDDYDSTLFQLGFSTEEVQKIIDEA